jgi:hypothetical protein
MALAFRAAIGYRITPLCPLTNVDPKPHYSTRANKHITRKEAWRYNDDV